MGTPTNRTPVRVARGSTTALNTGLSDIQEGEIVWDTTLNKLQVKEGSALEDHTVDVSTKQDADADLTALSSCQTGAATALALLTAAEVGALDGFTGDKDDLIYAKDLKATGVTDTEFDYLDGVTSAIQTQLDAKAPLAAPALTGTATAVNLTLSGDLTVNGTTTTVNSTNTTITDNLLELNSGAGSNANDCGILIERGSTGDNAIIAWDESADKFTVGTTTGTASSTGNITIAAAPLVASTVEDSKGDVRNIPASTNSTLVAADAGKHISITAGITINASTDFAIGDAVTIFNNQGAGNDETITATGIDLYLATDPSVSGATNRTLAPRGVATILCVAADKYVITGAGLS